MSETTPHAPFTLNDATIILIYEYNRRLQVCVVLDEGDEWGFERVLTLRFNALKQLLKECTANGYQVIRWQDLKPEEKRELGDVPLPPKYTAHRGIGLKYAGETIVQIHNGIVKGKHYSEWKTPITAYFVRDDEETLQ